MVRVTSKVEDRRFEPRQAVFFVFLNCFTTIALKAAKDKVIRQGVSKGLCSSTGEISRLFLNLNEATS